MYSTVLLLYRQQHGSLSYSIVACCGSETVKRYCLY